MLARSCSLPVRISLLAVMVAALVAGCRPGSPGLPPTVSPVAPVSPLSPLSPLPSPAGQVQGQASTFRPPTPAAGRAVVFGRLVAGPSGKPIGVTAFLGDVIMVEGRPGGYLNRSTAPFTLVDSDNGRFVLKDVVPGDYTLIFSEPERASRAYSTNGEVNVLKIGANQVLDLGDIPY